MSPSAAPPASFPALKWNIDQDSLLLCRRLPADGGLSEGKSRAAFLSKTHQTSKLLRVVCVFLFFFNEKATGTTPKSPEISSVSRLPPNGTNGGSDKKKWIIHHKPFIFTRPRHLRVLCWELFFYFFYYYFFIFQLQSVCEASQGHERKVLEITPGVSVKR